MAPPSTEGVTLSGLRIGARLEADSILEKSVPATDAEGSHRPNLSGKRTETTTFTPAMDDVDAVPFCESCITLAFLFLAIFRFSFHFRGIY